MCLKSFVNFYLSVELQATSICFCQPCNRRASSLRCFFLGSCHFTATEVNRTLWLLFILQHQFLECEYRSPYIDCQCRQDKFILTYFYNFCICLLGRCDHFLLIKKDMLSAYQVTAIDIDSQTQGERNRECHFYHAACTTRGRLSTNK